MTRGAKNPGATGHFVNGMEVSGIDPEIVREEQQAAERGPGDKAGPDLTALQQAVDLHKLQQTSGGVSQGYGQADTQPLFATGAGQGEDVRHYGHHVPYPSAQSGGYMSNTGMGPRGSDPNAGAVDGAGGSASAAQMMNSHALAERMANSSSNSSAGRLGKRRVRLGWTEEETRHLMEGCKRHGVGNWKKILTDPSFEFNCRTAVDLKDRFRTSFPEEYARLYPNARTHKVKRASAGAEFSNLVKIKRKERRAFTQEEDERLLQGFQKHGPAWSKIQRDQTLNLGDRLSTDLRDRFRNAFPDRYTAAGYKGRASQKATPVSTSAEMGMAAGQMPPSLNVLDDDVHLQHQGLLPRGGYISVQHPHHTLQMPPMGYQTPVYFGAPQVNIYRGGQPPQQN